MAEMSGNLTPTEPAFPGGRSDIQLEDLARSATGVTSAFHEDRRAAL